MIDRNRLSAQVKTRYLLENEAFVRTAKDDPADRIQVEVGDTKQPDRFYPQVKLMRWDNEVNFSARLVDDEKGSESIQAKGEAIQWAKGKKEAHFYEIEPSDQHLEGGYEFEVVLKEKPATNKVEFTIQTKGLDFFYQPELTQEEKDQGAERPENVVGSYAVYYREGKSGDYSKMGGKNYRAGKAFHIYRPRIEDAEGNWVWGELNVDEEKELLTVTIPQEFLDKAVYPVRHAAGLTFGYTTRPTTRSYYLSGNYAAGSAINVAVSANGNVDSVTFYNDGFGGRNFKGFITDSSFGILTNGVTNVGSTSDSGWSTATFGTKPSVVSGSNYYPFIVTQSGADVGYDNGSVGNSKLDTSNSYSSPSAPTDASDRSYKFAIYATYTAGSPSTNVEVTPSVQTATLSQPSPTVVAQKNVSVSVNEQTITFSQPSTTVTATKSVTASMEAQGLSASLPAPTVSTAQSVTIQPSVQSLTASQPEPTVSAAFLAVGKIALASPAHLSSGELTTCFVWEIPSFTTGRNVSFQLQIDKTDDTFGDIEVSKDSRKDSGFQYWDGEAWRDFGAEGVPVEYVGNQARIQVTLPTDGRKYWRVRGYS